MDGGSRDRRHPKVFDGTPAATEGAIAHEALVTEVMGEPQIPAGLPAQVQSGLEAGERLLREGHYAEAIRTWERLLGRTGMPAEEGERLRRRLARAYFGQAMAHQPLKGSRKDALRCVRWLEKAMEYDGGEATYPYWLGVIHRHYGLWEKAASYFRQALDIDPGHSWSRLELGWALMRRPDVSVAEVEALLGHSPAGTEIGVPPWQWRRLRAALLLKTGRPREAFEAYPDLPPDGFPLNQWYEERMHLAYAAGYHDPQQVLSSLESWLPGWQAYLETREVGAGAEGDLDSLWFLMGNLAADTGEEEKAQQYWQQISPASNLWPHAQANLTRLLDYRARRALAAGDLDEAIRLWEQAVGDAPRNRDVNAMLVGALIARGCTDWGAGRPEKALAAWNQAKDYNASVPAVWYNLALCHERLRNWVEANRCWAEFLKLQRTGSAPARNEREVLEEGDIYTRMAFNATRASRPDEALRFLAEAETRVGRDGRSLMLAGLLHLKAGNALKGVSYLQAALQEDPSAEAAVKGLVHAARMPGVDSSRIAKLLHRLLNHLPRDSWAFRYVRDQLLDMGSRAWESGVLDEAMNCFASMLLADPDDVEAWLWAGTVHMRRGSEEGARDCFDEAVNRNPQRPETYIFIGARFLSAGDRAKAEEYFQRALQVNPDPSIRVMIGEACAEIGVPELAEAHFQAAISESENKQPPALRAISSLIQAGYQEKVTPFLVEAHRLAPDIVPVRLLLAAQHVRNREWRQTQEQLKAARELAQRTAGTPWLEHADFFEHCMILLRTVGEIDEENFNQRVQRVLTDWMREEGAWEEPSEEVELDSLDHLINALTPDPEAVNCLLPPIDERESSVVARFQPAIEPDLDLFHNVQPPLWTPDAEVA